MASGNPFADPSQPTLADVEKVVGSSKLPTRRRRDMLSALRTFARVAGKDLADLPAVPGFLSRVAATCMPQLHGIGRGRWNNVLSLLRGALGAAGRPVTPGRYLAPLTPEWEALFHALLDIQDRRRITRLMHFCSATGVEPNQVDDTVLEQFRLALENESITKNPFTSYQSACRAWNRGSDMVPEWPQRKVTVPLRRQTYTLPLSAFPPSLAHEIDAYITHLSGNDLLSERSFPPVKASTAKHRKFQLLQIASALVAQGRHPNELQGLADLIKIDAVKLCLRYFLNRAGNQTTSQISSLITLINAVARHWVKVKTDHLEQLRALARRLKPERTGMTDKNQTRLRPLQDSVRLAALLRLPLELAAEAEAGTLTYRAALQVQKAIAMEILIVTAMRLNNLQHLDLDRHVIRSRPGGPLHLVIPKEEVKNAIDLEFPLPQESATLLDLYCRRYRPLLLDQPSRWLFPGENGRPKSKNTLSHQIRTIIRNRLGLDVNPHLFRHIAALAYLRANPGGHEVVRRVLGHKSLETTTNFYTGLETEAALRHFDEQILTLRHATHAAVNEGRRRC
jgi:integrase